MARLICQTILCMIIHLVFKTFLIVQAYITFLCCCTSKLKKNKMKYLVKLNRLENSENIAMRLEQQSSYHHEICAINSKENCLNLVK